MIFVSLTFFKKHNINAHLHLLPYYAAVDGTLRPQLNTSVYTIPFSRSSIFNLLVTIFFVITVRLERNAETELRVSLKYFEYIID